MKTGQLRLSSQMKLFSQGREVKKNKEKATVSQRPVSTISHAPIYAEWEPLEERTERKGHKQYLKK